MQSIYIKTVSSYFLFSALLHQIKVYLGIATCTVRERSLMMSDFLGDGCSEMTPKNWTLEGKNRTLGGEKLSKIVEHH